MCSDVGSTRGQWHLMLASGIAPPSKYAIHAMQRFDPLLPRSICKLSNLGALLFLYGLNARGLYLGRCVFLALLATVRVAVIGPIV